MSTWLAQIHTLPPELIANIFFWYVAREVDVYEDNVAGFPAPKRNYPRPYSWLKIRHVCRLWRAIALDTPTLSTRIVVSRPDCVEEMIRTSGTMPLHLISGDQFSDTKETLAAYSRMFSQFHRVHRATISLTNQLLEFLRSPRTLEAFDTSALEDMRINFLNVSYRDFRLAPSMLADSTFPALRTLRLHGGELSLCASMFSSSLRNLYLRFLDYPHSADRLLVYLEGLRNLECLVVRECIEEENIDQFINTNVGAPHRSITFPKLRRLVLNEVLPDQLFQFFGHVIYPVDASVAIGHSFTSSRITLDIITRCLIEKLRGNLPRGNPPTILRVTVDKDHSAAIRIKLWTTAGVNGGAVTEQNMDKPLLELFVSALNAREIPYMIQILCQLPISHVLDLRISHVHLDDWLWEQLFLALPALHSLTVEGERGAQSLPHGLVQSVYPNLKTIHYDLSWSRIPPLAFEKIARALSQRKNQGSPLDLLTVVLHKDHCGSDDIRDKLSSFSGIAKSVQFELASGRTRVV